MPRKLTYEEVKFYIESQGYQLLSSEYKNNQTKLEIECPEGHHFHMSYNYFQGGQRCPICWSKRRSKDKLLNYDYVKDYIESYEYKLLSKEYKGNNKKLMIECPEGHNYKVKFNDFQQNCRCPYCNGGYRYDYDYVKSYIESYNYKLISKEYTNALEKDLLVECPEGHCYYTKFNYFQQGYRCQKCYNKRRGKSLRHSIDYVQNYIESYGYKLISKEYKNTHQKLRIKCPEEHIFKMSYSDFHVGNRCPICNYTSLSSKAEKEIQQFLSSIYNGKILPNDRNTIINPLTGYYLELDAYLPEINVAIEYNGTYWHSDKYQQVKDKIKKEQCEKLGIDILVINEHKWKSNKNDCLNKITNFIFH